MLVDRLQVLNFQHQLDADRWAPIVAIIAIVYLGASRQPKTHFTLRQGRVRGRGRALVPLNVKGKDLDIEPERCVEVIRKKLAPQGNSHDLTVPSLMSNDYSGPPDSRTSYGDRNRARRRRRPRSRSCRLGIPNRHVRDLVCGCLGAAFPAAVGRSSIDADRVGPCQCSGPGASGRARGREE